MSQFDVVNNFSRECLARQREIISHLHKHYVSSSQRNIDYFPKGFCFESIFIFQSGHVSPVRMCESDPLLQR